MTPQPQLDEFEKKVGYRFTDRQLLTQVFVHRSYLNEHRSFPLEHNERMEFLGDAVLELVVTEHLYRSYDSPEGQLTNWRSALVKGETLSECARELNMEEHLLLSKGESRGVGKARQLILANVFEAFVGALYLDGGYKRAQAFVKKVLLVKLDEIIEKELYLDPKSRFQELMQDRNTQTPTYRVLKEEGPDHNKMFKVGVYVGAQLMGSGSGASKNKAQQEAARDALNKISKEE